MARTRNLKHGFFRNETLAECDPLARLLWAGMWTIADREGRLEDRPKRIKADVLPYDNCDVDDLLCQLERGGFIIRYRANEQGYIQITTWKRHQQCHVNENASVIPAPEEYGTSTVQVPEGQGANSPLTNMLTANMLEIDAAPPVSGYEELDDLFEKFWAVFPERKGRKAGPKETVKAAFAKVPVKEWPLVVEAAGNYARWCEDADEYAIDPIRFFKNSKWREYRKPIEVKQGKNGAGQPIRIDLKGPTPPDGYSWVRNDLGEFVPLERGPDGMFPTGTPDIVESNRRENALKLEYIRKRDGKGVGVSA